MVKVLVTGGAGYIGSHAVRELLDKGYDVVVVDNLYKGIKVAVDERAKFYEVDLADFDKLNEVFIEEKFDAVMHFAGAIEVGESMKKPRFYMETNVIYGQNLLEVMKLNGVDKVIFSSTAAVYGVPESVPIKEDDVKNPTNIYGFSKLTFEGLLNKYDEFWNMKYVALRYFNASGAHPSGDLGQNYFPDTHLLPRLLKTVMGKYDKFYVFGTDYNTKDGTCVRDYVHVMDLVDAHLLALDYCAYC